MERIRNWLLPALLAVVQLSVWPGYALLRGETVEAPRLVVGLAVTVAATAVLGTRRRFPVASALVIDALTLTGQFVVPDEGLGAAAVAGVVALYSVAVLRPGRTAVLVAAVMIGSAVLGSLTAYDSAVDIGGEALASLTVFAGTVGAGRSRRQWLAGRRAAERELARAEAVRGRAATTERDRLARELHDVSAHHLTSVVVTAEAARRLGDRRPELTADALRSAAEGGRATVEALHRLVTVMRTSAADEESPLEERVTELAAGFVRLGQRVSLDIAPGPAALTGPVAEAAFALVRESLTNALRYAPGTAVHVVLRDGGEALDLVVRDDGTPGPPPDAATASVGAAPAPAVSAVPAVRQGLGAGRGTSGMRERAVGLGGSFAAGPRPDGPGWVVRARLPYPSAAGRRNSALPRVSSADTATVLAVAALPVVAVLIERPAATATACLPAVLHALPLLWRRQAPWTALLLVLATAWIPPVALAHGLLPSDVAWALTLTGACAECVALRAVAAYAGPPGRTWPAILLVAGGLAAATVTLDVLSGGPLTPDGGDGGLGTVGFLGFLGVLGFVAVIVAGFLAFLMAGVWGLGVFVRRRRERVTRREDSALSAAVWSAVVEAYEERQRIAAELRQAVLRHADEVVAHAERADLDGAADQARAALTAMRGLLAVLRQGAATDTGTEHEEMPPSKPQPPSQPRDKTQPQPQSHSQPQPQPKTLRTSSG
ncbi:histidine kinase [Streptomyces phaeolivaceus]|uniref:histidine kinase n=1 Tax=Streptomyces phaeolivaceus TaxID=2653200 RepID=A0A5P8K6P3_9ACTN|nr:histidine kinase [Streptomyces phaeolivaceus]QFQ98993.1 histidine kinase [Streptomyces phaeolivaceus]